MRYTFTAILFLSMLFSQSLSIDECVRIALENKGSIKSAEENTRIAKDAPEIVLRWRQRWQAFFLHPEDGAKPWPKSRQLIMFEMATKDGDRSGQDD